MKYESSCQNADFSSELFCFLSLNFKKEYPQQKKWSSVVGIMLVMIQQQISLLVENNRFLYHKLNRLWKGTHKNSYIRRNGLPFAL